MDESHREGRPLEAPVPATELRREVEPPRTAAGLWMPFMALASAAMLTIVSGIAVMTRPPRAQMAAPVELESTEPKGLTAEERENLERTFIKSVDRQTQMLERLEASRARMDAHREQNRVMCRAPVRRGDIDGRTQPYDECIVPADLKAKATAKGPVLGGE